MPHSNGLRFNRISLSEAATVLNNIKIQIEILFSRIYLIAEINCLSDMKIQ